MDVYDLLDFKKDVYELLCQIGNRSDKKTLKQLGLPTFRYHPNPLETGTFEESMEKAFLNPATNKQRTRSSITSMAMRKSLKQLPLMTLLWYGR